MGEVEKDVARTLIAKYEEDIKGREKDIRIMKGIIQRLKEVVGIL